MKTHELRVVFWKQRWRDRAERLRAAEWRADTNGLLGAYRLGSGRTKMEALLCLLQQNPELLGSVEDWAILKTITVKDQSEVDAALRGETAA